MAKKEGSKRPKLLIVDGSSLLFRAFYAIRNLTTKDGIATNGVYGFLNMYLKAADTIEPDYVLVAFDRSSKTFRKEDYEAYKGNRQEIPPELAPQFGMTKDLLDVLGIAHFDIDGYEADDIAGTVSLKASQEGWHSYLLTGDRDYFQLVDANSTVLFTKKGISELEEITPEVIQDRYGLSPKQLIDVKGLQGDSSDNIPGVPGIGEKTALKLIRSYRSLDGVYDHLEEVSGKKMKENLQAYKEQAYLSKQLGTIYRQVPMEKSLEDFQLGQPDREELADRFERLEFQSLAGRFSLEEEKTADHFQAAFLPKGEWEACCQRLSQEKQLYCAFFSSGKNYQFSKPVNFIARGGRDDRAVVFSLRGEEKFFSSAAEPIFQEGGPELISYDIKESMVLAHKLGLSFLNPYKDLMLMEYLIDPSRSSYDLDGLAKSYTSYRVMNREELLGKGKKRREFQDLDEEDLLQYAGGYLSVLAGAQKPLEDRIHEMGMEDLYRKIENPLALVLARMESQGVMVDRDRLRELDKEFSRELEDYEEEVYKYADGKMNINSPKQLGELLFEELKLPHGKKTKTGYSTSAEVLEKLRDAHPVVEAILNYRKLQKLKSTYIDGFIPYIQEDGRIRSIFCQNVAATGRISSTEPNLQNIPVRTEEGRKLRSVFTSDEGRLLVDADYSQIELRILASLSGDPVMIKAFREGMDIHRKTAAEVNHIAPEEVTAEERSRAKAVNFGIIYGISDYGLSRDLNISRQEAKEYITRYKDTYSKIREFMDQLVRDAKEKGYVDTFYGRRRNIPELKSKNFNIRSFGERIALNTPIQGTAADVIKLAMIRVDRRLREEGFRARLVLQIHDELIVEAPKEEAEKVGRLLVEVMEGIGEFPVDLKADMNQGKTWYDAK